jgi:hypothetical protein
MIVVMRCHGHLHVAVTFRKFNFFVLLAKIRLSGCTLIDKK